VLGISENATQDEIKSAYRRLARENHPDVNPNNPEAEEKFKEIGEAYATLSDPDKRRQYDQKPEENFSFGGFNSFFRTEMPNSPVVIQVEMTMDELLRETKKNISYQRVFNCSSCKGEQCPECRGSGVKITTQKFDNFHFYSQQSSCQRCFGRGEIRDQNCHQCHGKGKYLQNDSIEVVIPVGSALKALIIEGMGSRESQNQPPGPLILEIMPKISEQFAFAGNYNLLYNYDIDPVRAMLGGEISVPTPEGDMININLKPGVQHGHAEEIKGYGLPISVQDRGSIYVKFNYVAPNKLSDQQKASLQQYLDLSENKNKREGKQL
jgi:molecular chaperone DnaJ